VNFRPTQHLQGSGGGHRIPRSTQLTLDPRREWSYVRHDPGLAYVNRATMSSLQVPPHECHQLRRHSAVKVYMDIIRLLVVGWHLRTGVPPTHETGEDKWINRTLPYGINAHICEHRFGQTWSSSPSPSQSSSPPFTSRSPRRGPWFLLVSRIAFKVQGPWQDAIRACLPPFALCRVLVLPDLPPALQNSMGMCLWQRRFRRTRGRLHSGYLWPRGS
jgi:hypothetical protein